MLTILKHRLTTKLIIATPGIVYSSISFCSLGVVVTSNEVYICFDMVASMIVSEHTICSNIIERCTNIFNLGSLHW